MIVAIILGFIWFQLIAHIGVSIGLHRCLAHKACKLNKYLEIFILYISVIIGARSPLGWVAAHRMHHAHTDTELDPHSPKILGFWKVFLHRWSIKKIPRRYCADLLRNKRIMFFHHYWKQVWAASAVVSLLISIEFFIGFIVMPFVLSFIGFGLVNALTHNDKIKNILWVNILAAGEGYHLNHHNGKIIRFGKYDTSGILLERFINFTKQT